MSAVRGDRYAGPLALGIFPVMYTSEQRVPMEWKLLQKNWTQTLYSAHTFLYCTLPSSIQIS